MDDYESLSHTTWTCKYHVVFIPKGRRRALYQELRGHLGELFRKLALQRESKVEEGHTVGRDEEAIRAYIRNQQKEDQRLEQLSLWR